MDMSEIKIDDDENDELLSSEKLDEMTISREATNIKIIRSKTLGFRESIVNYVRKINFKVLVSIVLFTLGSWLDISALWCELPLLVQRLPEGWRLPSILSASSQLAQIGTLIYPFFKYTFPKQFKNSRTIFLILSIGAVSCFLLALFWDKTSVVYHERRSIYLYTFNFFLSLLGMSTLTFLPYIGENFSKEYILGNYIGESCSSLLPAILAMVQGTGRDEDCSAHTISNMTLPVSSLTRPNYSISTYFMLMFILILISISSFAYLHFSKTARNERKQINKKFNLDDTLNSTVNESFNLKELNHMDETSDTSMTDVFTPDKMIIKVKNRNEITVLLFLTFFTSFTNYGYLPGLLSYSTIPYGNKYFHLSINLSNALLLVSILASIGSYNVKVKQILIESFVPIAISIYITVASIKSPCPQFVNTSYGGYLMVASWIICSTMFMRLRCLIATRLERYGEKVLFALGYVSIVGQIIGGVLIYIIVDVYRLLKDKDNCSTNNVCV